ncbi:hypothetical protein ACTFIY_000126 [Dictyostelium cf. discoideum]
MTFPTKFELLSKEVFSNYMFILSRFLYENDHLCDDGPNHCPDRVAWEIILKVMYGTYYGDRGIHIRDFSDVGRNIDQGAYGIYVQNNYDKRKIYYSYDPENENISHNFQLSYSFRNNGTRVTNQQISEYSIYDRFVFETETFVVSSYKFTILILPIQKFSTHLLTLEVIID